MILELYGGETRLRTIYNVIKVTQDFHHQLVVTNKVDGEILTNTFIFNKQYNRFKIVHQ